MKLYNGLIQRRDGPQTRQRDSPAHDSSVVYVPTSFDQSPLFKPIEKASHIRIVSDHSLGNPPARQSIISCAAQNSQHVVLRRREIRFLQYGFKLRRQGIRGAEDG